MYVYINFTLANIFPFGFTELYHITIYKTLFDCKNVARLYKKMNTK